MGGRSSKKNAKAVVPYDPDEPLSQEELDDPKAYEKRIKKSRYASLQAAVAWNEDNRQTFFRKHLERMHDEKLIAQGKMPVIRPRERNKKGEKRAEAERINRLAIQVAEKHFPGMHLELSYGSRRVAKKH